MQLLCLQGTVCVTLAVVLPGELCHPLSGGEEQDAGCYGEGGRERGALCPCTTASLSLRGGRKEGRVAVAWERRWLFLACWNSPGVKCLELTVGKMLQQHAWEVCRHHMGWTHFAEVYH